LEFVPALLVASSILDPIVVVVHSVLTSLALALHNYGWALIAMAALVKLVFWPLNTMQFKSMLKMQALQPQIKRLQARYKDDKEKLNQETMKLYKESGANPLAGCFPLLLQMPILFSLYWAIIQDKGLFAKQTWLWIGSPLSLTEKYPVLAKSLAQPDYLLLVAYILSMYFSVRFTSPAMDPQQAQQQKIMSLISPAMIGYLSFKYAWPSALILYWLSFNVFQVAQQLFLIRRYHTNPAAIGPHPEAVTANALAAAADAAADGAGGTPRARSKRSKRSKR